MNPADDLPENDPLAPAAQRALGRLGGDDAIDLEPWSAVQARGRRIKVQRLSAIVAACAVVVVGIGAAAAVNRGSDDHATIAGRNATTTTSATTTSTTASTTTTTTAPPVIAPVTPVAPGTVPNTPPPATAPNGEQVLQPQDGSWDAVVSADVTSVTAGDDFIVSVELKNTGTQLQSTDGYGSWAIACTWADQSATDPGPADLPVGGFPDGAILRPGESQTFSQTFHAETDDVGSLRCGASIVFFGAAHTTDTSNGVIVAVVAATETTTTTVPSVTTTSTTAP